MAIVKASPGMTVLGALRKSVVRKRHNQPEDRLAASLELQQAQITAAFPKGTRFIWAPDEDVSGAVSPFKRPHLGPLITDLSAWTHLAVARFDRVSRSVRHFSDLIEWLDEHGKILVCLSPPIDLSDPGGRAFAQMLAVFAEYERELDRERVRDSWAALKDAGKWPGGTIPFGRIPVPDGDQWRLAPDPAYLPVANSMVDRYLAGDSLATIAAAVEAQGVPMPRDTHRVRNGREPRGKGWTARTVKSVLSSPSLGGFVSSGGELRRDADNVAIRIDPLISPEKYERVQVALGKRANNRNMDATPLLGVAYCFLCSAPLHGASHVNPDGSVSRYYVCSNAREGTSAGKCDTSKIKASVIEQQAEREFLGTAGGQKILEPVYIAAVDHSADLADVNEAIEHLETQYATGKVYQGADGAERFARMMTRLEERRDKLAAITSVPARTDYRETDTTFAEKWNASDQQAWRRLMAESGFRIYFARLARDLRDVTRDIQRQGITKTAAQLRTRESHARAVLATTSRPAVAARLEAELAEIVEQRRQLREIPRYHEYMAAPVGPELARRAGLAASGQVADLPDTAETWEQLLAPARRVLRRPRPVS